MATTKKVAPVTELGYVQAFPGMLAAFSQWDWFEQNPELLWPSSVRTFTRMAREDSRLASLLRAVGLPVRRTRWMIDPNGARPEVVEHVASDLGLPVKGDDDDDEPRPRMRGRFSWSQHLQWALKFQQFGHSVFERVYEVDDSGRAHLSRLSPRPQSTIAFWDVALNGDLTGLQQWPAGTLGWTGGVFPASLGGTKMIPGNRLLSYVHDQDPGTWVGNSLLRPAYGNWMFKVELQRIEVIAARRHGVGTPKINVSEDESTDQTRLDFYGDIATQWRSGMSAGIALPFGTDAEIMGVSGTLPGDLIRQGIVWHDKQMGLNCLAHFMNLDGGGSYALASVLLDPFIEAENAEAEMIRDTAQSGIVEDIVTVNWGPDEPVPMLTFEEIGSRLELTAASMQLLAQAGLVVPDQPLQSYVRQNLGLPSPDPDTAVPTDAGMSPQPSTVGDQPPDPDAGDDASGSNDFSISNSAGRVPVRAYTRRAAAKKPRKAKANGDATLW